MITKPEQNLYPGYYQKYIDKVSDGDIIEILNSNKEENIKFFSDFSDEQTKYRYAEGKWSIKEVFGHIIDLERILSDRALKMARNDKTNIPQYDHDAYVAEAKFDIQDIGDLIKQYKASRESAISLFKSFDNAAWERVGISGGKEFVVKCFPFIMAGHELHHIQILKERYLPEAKN